MIPAIFDTTEPQVVSADGTRIWAAQAGRPASDAPTIVFVPGFALPSLLFEKQFQDAELLAKYCLITYEPRGQGRSTAVSPDGNPWSSDKIAQDFAAVCHFYGARKVFLAGWSYGCVVACDIFASDMGDAIAGLVYIAGMPCKNDFPACYSPLTAEYSPRMAVAAMADTDTVGQLFSAFVETCVHAPLRRAMPYTLKTALMGSIALTPASQRLREATVRTQDATKLLAAAPRVETLYVHGRHDEVVEPAVIQAYLAAHFARLQTAVVEDAGHAPFWERPEEMRRVLVEFVDRVSGV